MKKIHKRTLAHLRLFQSLPSYLLPLSYRPSSSARDKLGTSLNPTTFERTRSARPLPCFFQRAALKRDPRLSRRSSFTERGADAKAGTPGDFRSHHFLD